MSRVLVVGFCPLPYENERRLYGPGIRTWQFARPLLDAGHEVCLVTSRIPGAYAAPRAPSVHRDGRLVHHAVEPDTLHHSPFLQRVHDAFRPDCVVGATGGGSAVAVALRTPAPVWADTFGDIMSEAQAKAYVYGDDTYVVDFWSVLRPVLDRADVFSSVSERQAYALVGALGTRGRLNRLSLGYRFVHTIPCGADEAPLPEGQQVGRSPVVAGDDFVVLWSGSYNTWTDVDLLFAGLEAAMARNPRIRFVSTGGQVDGHDERTYPRFLCLIAASRFRERFSMRGWLPTQEVPRVYAEASVGIHLDRPIYERELGSENRVLSWMRAGLPVLCSNVSELSAVIEQEELGFTFPANDAAGLAEAVLALAAKPERCRERAARAQAYVVEHWSYARTTRALQDWVAAPAPAPDRGQRVPLERHTGGLSLAQRAVRLRESLRTRGVLATGRDIVRKRLGGWRR
jgi:glycosyltransferase involved in cell wall biosynthesis